MKYTTLAVSAIVAWTLPLRAAGQIEVGWHDVCRVAAGHQLVLKTVQGKTTDGYCISITADEIAVVTKDKRAVTIARASPSRIQMYRPRHGHQLSTLGSGMRKSLRFGFDSLFTPYAPLGLAVVPGTVAWGAVAAPFCLLSDLKNKVTRKQEIKVI